MAEKNRVREKFNADLKAEKTALERNPRYRRTALQENPLYNLSLRIIPGDGTPADCALLTSMICFDDIESYSVDRMFPPIGASCTKSTY